MLQLFGMMPKKISQARLSIDKLNAQRMSGRSRFEMMVRQLLSRQKTGMYLIQKGLLYAVTLGCRQQAMTQGRRTQVMPEAGKLGTGSLRKIQTEGSQVAHDHSSRESSLPAG